jgi:hypothetical protein
MLCSLTLVINIPKIAQSLKGEKGDTKWNGLVQSGKMRIQSNHR